MHSYGEVAAQHYAAYRPPLHGLILREALDDMRVDWALDFGCGTGQSSLALADYANKVIGIDNSADMLAKATPHARISYRLGHEGEIPASDGSIELITMAGVLPYLDRNVLIPELRRIAATNAVLLTYDFKVDLTPLLQLFPDADLRSSSGYDHRTDMRGADIMRITDRHSSTMDFELNGVQATHLVLANEDRFRKLSCQANVDADLVSKVLNKKGVSGFEGRLSAAVNWTLHDFDHQH